MLPAKLSSLHLQLAGKYTDAAINGVLQALAALPLLSRLFLALSSFGAETAIDLSLLAACPSLTDLQLQTDWEGSPKLSFAQLEQVRSSLGHLQRFSAGWLHSGSLTRLLQPPVTAQWRDIGYVYADERTGGLLLRLLSLRKLQLVQPRYTAHADFLSQLPQLTALELHCNNDQNGGWFIPADALLASLVRCTCITELELNCGFTSAHWSALFAKLALKTLTIRRGEIDTLRCFASGPITQSLQELTSRDVFVLPPSELPHLYSLRRLRILRLLNCFSPRLSDATIASLSPPTRLLPSLTSLSESHVLDKVERRGLSWEWLQERLTH